MDKNNYGYDNGDTGENEDDDCDYETNKNIKIEKNLFTKVNKKKLIVVLEHANLELTKDKREPKLINSDDHSKLLRKMNKTLEEYRPDITHQCLLTLFDSPLNKAGFLQVYIRTKNNVLIEINPKCRIPRTFKRFSGLFTQLLLKLKIRAAESSEVLLKVIKNPITDHLPIGAPIIATCEKSRLIDTDEYARSLDNGKPVVMVIGSMSQGDLNIDYNHDSISVSSFPLSASVCCGKVCTSFEKIWDIL